jgi:hypothetical protein
MTAPITRPRRKPGPKGPRAAPSLVPISARIPPALAAWLEAEAAARGCPRGDVIRSALTDMQQRSEPD